MPAGTFFSNPSFEARRLWSLWDMINFRFTAVHLLLAELNRSIVVSHQNKSFEGQHDLSEIPEHQRAMSQIVQAIRYVVDGCPVYFRDLNSAHIAAATERLKHWLDDNNRTWSELNIRARALRDNI